MVVWGSARDSTAIRLLWPRSDVSGDNADSHDKWSAVDRCFADDIGTVDVDRFARVQVGASSYPSGEECIEGMWETPMIAPSLD